MFKKVLAVFVLLLGMAFSAEAADMKARIPISSREELSELLLLGLDIVYVKPGSFVDVFISQDMLEILEARGIFLEILIPDLEEYYEDLMGPKINFGPYYTYAEMQELLDSLHTAFPEITTGKIDIGTSWEGRTIWAMKVSDSPNEKEDKPGVLYTGVTHAREPIGCSICIDLIRYLCQHYRAGDPEVVNIVRNCQLWFIPVVNPDGYVYNESGSGWWRKNRRPDPGPVDINRNFPYMWGYDNRGSSPNPGSEVYRGPSPASEPETQAVINLCDSFSFYTAIDYHSYGNDILTPFCYDTFYTPDSALYREMGDSMSLVNGYPHGTGWEILYFVNGCSKDWEYGQHRIFDFTVEVGEAFWQPDTAIIREQFEENLYPNLYLARQAIRLAKTEEEREAFSKLELKIWPNPTSGITYLRYYLGRDSFVSLKIYDVSGRLVKTLLSQNQPSGAHFIPWNGRDQSGSLVSAGIYFCWLKTKNSKVTKKLILIP